MRTTTNEKLEKVITDIENTKAEIEKSKEKGEPYKIMFVGINGTGKTTTIAKKAQRAVLGFVGLRN